MNFLYTHRKSIGLFLLMFANVFLLGVLVFTMLVDSDLTDTQLFLKWWWLYLFGICCSFEGLFLVSYPLRVHNKANTAERKDAAR